ncbi:hypothetical protein BSKO_13106 [Bryopsis sp. KO-2023]|nr:hypothetical protein BSKO_13106 [Bryopsis sp. KO-2023]
MMSAEDHGEFSVGDLPTDILRCVISRLNGADLENCRLVSKDWSRLVLASTTVLKPIRLASEEICRKFPDLTGLILDRSIDVTDDEIQRLDPNSLHSLRHLDLSCCKKISNRCLKRIADFGSLTNVSFRSCKEITLNGLEQLSKLHRLTSLNLAGTSIRGFDGETSSRELSQSFGRLRSLKLGNGSTLSEIDDAFLCTLLSLLPNITELDLSGCVDLHLEGAGTLPLLKNLKTLVLQNCLATNAMGIAHVAETRSLTSLNLRGMFNLLDEHMICLSSLVKLETLSLQSCEKLTGAFFPFWTTIRELKHLNLGKCASLTAQGLSNVSLSFPYLLSLNLDNCDNCASAINMNTLGALRSLKELSLRDIKCLRHGRWDWDRDTSTAEAGLGLTTLVIEGSYGYGTSGAVAIGKMTNLRELDLGACDQRTFIPGGAFLRSLSHLVALSLKNCYVLSLPELRHISALERLTSLDLSRCGNRTPDVGTLVSHISTRQTHYHGDLIPQEMLSLWDSFCLAGDTNQWEKRQAFVDTVIQGASDDIREECKTNDSTCGVVERCNGMTEITSVLASTAQMSQRPSSCDSELEEAFRQSDFDVGLCWGSLFPAPTITSLILRGCDHLTDMGIAALGRVHTLRKLAIDCCKHILGTGMSAWQDLVNLTDLSVQDCRVLCDTGLECLAKSLQKGTLRRLDISGCRGVTDKGMMSLRNLRGSLSNLCVCACTELSNKGLGWISRLHELRSLNISICPDIDDRGLQRLSGLRNLTELDMKFCWRVGDDGMSAVAQLISLKRLTITGCHNITKEGMACVGHISVDSGGHA